MLDARRRACLEAMGIELWESRHRPEQARQPTSAPPMEPGLPGGGGTGGGSLTQVVAAGPGDAAVRVPEPVPATLPAAIQPDDPGAMDWQTLRSTVVSCQSCELSATRTQTVFGCGDASADLLVIGEAPGAEEDRQGEPFVGRAGKLLTAMLNAIGLAREQVFIANIVKCRPPGNRDPHRDETAACQAYLHRQIALIEPKVILSVGRVSAQNLLGTDEAVGRLRGRVHRFDPGNVPLIVSYHPAYLLRRPEEKAKAWQDLQRVAGQLATPV